MFALAEQAAGRGDLALARQVYAALSADRNIDIRSEARFRLGLMLENEHRYSEAATQFRTILDEKPQAQRVRLELAAVLAKLGDIALARRELRAVRAGVLPPEVARQVDRFSEALRARKPFGGTFELALASDSNINRATRSDTLGTVIGDFTLDKNARAQSGRGVALQGQAYRRIAMGNNSDLLATVAGSANLYRNAHFNDISVGASLGPELPLGDYQVHASAGGFRRWFGQAPFTDAGTLQVDVERPIGATAQVRGTVVGSRIWNHQNRLESGYSYSASVDVEAALSTTTGAGATATGIRQSLDDSGYSTTSGQLSLFGWHEAGRVTLTAQVSYGRLKADERLLLFLHRRNETLYRATVGATIRNVQVDGFAPVMTFSWERNRSPVEIFDYARTVVNIGITRAF
jgi:tetratricopeptide (TPR) repeat protein